MSAGSMTIEIAKGVTLWAQIQEFNMVNVDCNVTKAWRDWCSKRTPEQIQYVQDLQSNLFDDINHRCW